MKHLEWMTRYLAKFRQQYPGLPKGWEAVQIEEERINRHLSDAISRFPDDPEQAAIECLKEWGFVDDSSLDDLSNDRLRM